MSGDAERSVVTVGGWGGARRPGRCGGEGDVVTLAGPLCPRCAVARTPRPAARAATCQQSQQQPTSNGLPTHSTRKHNHMATQYVYDQTPYCTSCGSLSTVHNRRFPFGSLEVIGALRRAPWTSTDLLTSP